MTNELGELADLSRPDDPYDLKVPSLDTEGSARLAAGDLDGAYESWRLIAELPNADPAQKPSAYYQAARPALWAGKAEVFREMLEALDATGIHGPIVEARRVTIRAGIAALEERTADARALYGEAIKAWHDLGMLWDEALTSLDEVLLIPVDSLKPARIAAARERLASLGAAPFVQLLDDRAVTVPSRPQPFAEAAREPATESA